MVFCSNCGEAIVDDAKFCSACGKACSTEPIEVEKTRSVVFEGEIHKCPQCGEVLDSFVVKCPSCGYELRDTDTTSAVKDFSEKFNGAENEYQKSNIVRSFPIPNTKEDIFEFMILVASNIDECPNKDMFDAWVAKFEQCYDKANLSFGDDLDFAKIQQIYDRTIKEIKRIQRKGPLKKILKIGIPILAIALVNVLFWAWVLTPDPKAEAEEVARLEAIVVEVETALENEEFDLAMMQAKSIDYNRSNSELERQWDIKRDYLIKKVIVKAAEKGIEMQYPTDTADEKDSSYNYSGDYQQMIDDFMNQVKDFEEQWNSAWGNTTEESEKNSEFEEGTYRSLGIKNFMIDIPNYWEEEGSKNEYLQYYAEKGDKVVMLSVAYPEESDDDYDVSFNGLYEDNENMKDAIASIFTKGDVFDSEAFESNYGVKGILYSYTCKQKVGLFKSIDATGFCFCFPSEKDRRWFYVYYIQTSNVSGNDYKDDYMTMISSIKEKK